MKNTVKVFQCKLYWYKQISSGVVKDKHALWRCRASILAFFRLSTLPHWSIDVLVCIYNTKYYFDTHTQNSFTWALYLLSRLIMTIFVYMYQWLQCGIKYVIGSRNIVSPPAQKRSWRYDSYQFHINAPSYCLTNFISCSDNSGPWHIYSIFGSA